MKITSFNPMIVSPKAEEAIAVFEALGFEKTHAPVTGTEAGDISCVRMKDANGFHVDVVSGKRNMLERDLTIIRINVDDFDEAAQRLLSNGYRESKIIGKLHTETSKYAFYVAPSGLIINLVQHIK